MDDISKKISVQSVRISILILILITFSGTLSAQGTIVINEKFEGVPLAKVLKKIRSEYKVKIAYDNHLVKDVVISVDLQNVPLSEALTRIFAPTQLTHQFINEKVIIIPGHSASTLKIATEVKRTTFSASGVIKDKDSGETLPNATILLAGTRTGAISNTDGFFTLLDVPSDTCSLIISYLGYASKKIKLNTEGDLSRINIGLNSDTKILEDVIVNDAYESPLQINDMVSKSAFDPRALADLPSLGGQDLFRTLQLMPGVGGTNESSAGLIIRGSIPSQNLILLDGFTIYHLDHFFGIFSGLNADIIKDVQIYKGGFDARYGGRVSGVVDITGRTGSTNKANFNVGVNLVSFNATADIPISPKISFLFSMRRAYTDVIQSSLYKKLFTIAQNTDDQLKRPLDDPKFDAIEPHFYFYDVNSKITYRPTQKDYITLSTYGGKDHLYGENINALSDHQNQISFEDRLIEDTRWGNQGLSLRWGRQWNEKFYSNLRLTGSNFFRNYSFNYSYSLDSTNFNQHADFDFAQDNRIEDSNLAFDNEWLISEKVTMEFGFSGMEYNIHYNTTANGEEADKRDDKGNLGSFYSTAKFSISEKWDLSFGIRSTHHQINKQWYNEPRLSATYKINERLNLKSAIGRYYQFVNQIQYDDPYNGIQNFWAFSNKDGAPVAESNHYIIGALYKVGDFQFDVEGYYKDLKGVVEFNPVPFFKKDGFLDLGLFLNGRGRMRGIDFLIQKESGIHKGWLSYSLSRSLNSYPAVERGTFFPSLQDQPQEIKLVNMVKLGKWNLSSTWIYGSGRPFPEYDILYFTDNQGNVEDFAVVKDRRNFSRLPDYHRLDISGVYNFVFQKFTSQVGLTIFNVYGRNNVKTRKLNIAALEKTIGKPEQPGPTYRDLVLINFTPSLFVNISF